MRKLLIGLGAIAVISVSAVVAAGLHPVFPGAFVANVLFVLPWAWIMHVCIRAGEGRIPAPALPWVGALLGLVILAAIALGTGLLVVQLSVMVLFLTAIIGSGGLGKWVGTAAGVSALVLGNVSVWSLNYLALLTARHRMADAAFRIFDASLYASLLRHPVSYPGLFPLTTGSVMISAFDAAYRMFFYEIALLSFVLGNKRDALARFLTQLFTCYGVAIAVFVVVPVAGPYLAYPASIRSIADLGASGVLMQGGQVEFASLMQGHQPVSGFGNFVGFPSLHAALAVLCQGWLRNNRTAFWTLLPVNLLMVASTVILGFHYVADTVAGLLMGYFVWRLGERNATGGRIAETPELV